MNENILTIELSNTTRIELTTILKTVRKQLRNNIQFYPLIPLTKSELKLLLHATKEHIDTLEQLNHTDYICNMYQNYLLEAVNPSDRYSFTPLNEIKSVISIAINYNGTMDGFLNDIGIYKSNIAIGHNLKMNYVRIELLKLIHAELNKRIRSK